LPGAFPAAAHGARARVASDSVVQGDVGSAEDLARALHGIQEAYYLVHAMRDRDDDFARRDREQAATFAAACRAAGVRRIIYLGGLGGEDGELSEHLRSRQETGAALAGAGVPVLEYRAAVIVGSGSASFEILRHLAERLPVMITPRWVATRCQPIAVRDVLAYLVRALEHPEVDGVHEIGGADVLTYGEMLTGYATVRGLRRLLIPVPVLTPGLSSWWVHLVTPVPRAIARPLIDGLRCEVVVRNPGAADRFGVEPMGYREAVARALRRLDAGDIDTAWHSSFASLSDATPRDRAFVNREGLLIEKHQRRVAVDAARAFAACACIGGDRGWPGCDWLWRLRAEVDRLLGGVGFRHGRRDGDRLAVGDALDFWRVVHLDPGRVILLHAEMKLTGEGWLQLRVDPVDTDGGPACTISATAFFAPRGAFGFLYWGATMPLHRLVFLALTAGLARWARSDPIRMSGARSLSIGAGGARSNIPCIRH